MTTKSPLNTALAQLQSTVDKLGLSENDWQTLSTPRRVLQVAVPLRRDNGDVEMYDGFRVQYSTTRGPSKGGVRYHPHVDLDETISLAMLMTTGQRKRATSSRSASSTPEKISAAFEACDPATATMALCKRD